MPLLILPVIAFVLCAVLHVIALWVFPKIGLLDFPERYGLTRGRLPYPAGILAVLAFCAVYAWWEMWDVQTVGTLAAITLLATVCFIDDRTPLPPVPRLVLQIAVAVIVVLTGNCTGGQICSLTNPLAGIVGGEIIDLNGMLPLLAGFVTVAWLMLTINALNWFDGIPGQVSTLSIIAFATIGSLAAFRLGETGLATLAFSLACIAAACALFDFPPPRVIMGDTGAMFFGLMLGILTIYTGGKVATAFLVLGVPLVDSLIVVGRRIAKGVSPLKGGINAEHLHHRLLARGWHPRSVILLSAAIGTGFGVTALFLDTAGKMIAALGLLLVMAGLSHYSRPRA